MLLFFNKFYKIILTFTSHLLALYTGKNQLWLSICFIICFQNEELNSNDLYIQQKALAALAEVLHDPEYISKAVKYCIPFYKVFFVTTVSRT